MASTPVKKASLETLKDLSFLPDAVAEAIYAKFHSDEAGTPVARPQRAWVRPHRARPHRAPQTNGLSTSAWSRW